MPASETPALSIVDAQIHLWGTGLPNNQAHRQVTAFTAGAAIALMDAGGVDAAVLRDPRQPAPGGVGGGGGHRHLAPPAGHAGAAFLAAR